MELSFWRLDVVTGWVSLDSDLAAPGFIGTLALEHFHLIVLGLGLGLGWGMGDSC